MQFLLVLVARYIYTSSFARFARSATSPSFAYQGAGQLSVQSCCSPIASACPPRLRPLPGPIASLLQLLLPVCVRFQLLLPDCARFCYCCMLAACVRFSCCSRSRPLQLLLPDCVRFDCCSPNCSASWIAALNVLEHSSRSSRFSKVRRSHVTIV